MTKILAISPLAVIGKNLRFDYSNYNFIVVVVKDCMVTFWLNLVIMHV